MHIYSFSTLKYHKVTSSNKSCLEMVVFKIPIMGFGGYQKNNQLYTCTVLKWVSEIDHILLKIVSVL